MAVIVKPARKIMKQHSRFTKSTTFLSKKIVIAATILWTRLKARGNLLK